MFPPFTGTAKCPSQIGLEHSWWFWSQDRGAVCLLGPRSTLCEQRCLCQDSVEGSDPALGSLALLPGEPPVLCSAEPHVGKPHLLGAGSGLDFRLSDGQALLSPFYR